MLVVFHVQPEYINSSDYIKKVIKEIKSSTVDKTIIVENENNTSFDDLIRLNCLTIYTHDTNFGWLLNLQVDNHQIDRDLVLNFFSKNMNQSELDLTDELTIKFISHLKSIKNNLQDDDLEESILSSLKIFKNSIDFISTQIPNNSKIIGGSIDACLIELELGFIFLQKSYSIDYSLCYKG